MEPIEGTLRGSLQKGPFPEAFGNPLVGFRVPGLGGFCSLPHKDEAPHGRVAWEFEGFRA